MTTVIRQATNADLPAVLALCAELDVGSAGDEQGLTLAQAQALLAEFARYPSYRLFVACEGAHSDAPVVATYTLLVMHNLAHGGTPSAIVEDVVVAHAHQGKGLGTQLMKHAMALAAQAGCYKLALSSNGRRLGAHAFYESLGFARHGVSFAIDPRATGEAP